MELNSAEKTRIAGRLTQVKYLTADNLKQHYDPGTDVTETLRKLRNVFACAEILKAYTEDAELQRQLDDIVAEIISEI